ncbi:MAG: hypothetical protein GY859_09665 [Desulfobacterales bacterium]|nr:hypothetical protein [Desulfobacterales bacterium]
MKSQNVTVASIISMRRLRALNERFFTERMGRYRALSDRRPFTAPPCVEPYWMHALRQLEMDPQWRIDRAMFLWQNDLKSLMDDQRFLLKMSLTDTYLRITICTY